MLVLLENQALIIIECKFNELMVERHMAVNIQDDLKKIINRIEEEYYFSKGLIFQDNIIVDRLLSGNEYRFKKVQNKFQYLRIINLICVCLIIILYFK